MVTKNLELHQRLITLSAMRPDELLDFFHSDLTGIPAKKIIGNLKMAMMFLDLPSRDALKQSILGNLAPTNQDPELVAYLKRPTAEELASEIPLHTALTKEEEDEVKNHDVGGASGMPGHHFEEKLQAAWRMLTPEIKTRFERESLEAERFNSIILTYLKDIRDRLETTQRLVAKTELGGMNFPRDLVDKILSVLDEWPPKKILSSALAVPTSAVSVKKVGSVNITRINELKGENDYPPKVSEPSGRNNTRSRPAPTARAGKFTDIAYPANTGDQSTHHLTGPIEEFSMLTVEDFRRAPQHEDFVRKVLDKLNLLAAEDYNQKMAAIDAWHRSALYKLYIDIGQKSLGQGLNVADYLHNSPASSLTEEEFYAITELNQKMRF